MKNKVLGVIGLSNEIGGVTRSLRIDYDSYEHRGAKVMQLFNQLAAAMIVSEFKAMAEKPNFRGLPIYIGHPDVKAYYDKYRDHKAYGWVVDMIAHDDHLELVVDWTEPGEELLANEHFAYFSPYWLTKRVSGQAVPFFIRSVGLTHEPMIQYLACEEEEPTQQEGSIMDKLFERLKALLPEKVQESIANADDLTAFFQKMLDGLKALRESQQERWKAEDAAYLALENEDLVEGLTAYLAELSSQADSLANEVPPETAATLSQVNDELALANESLAGIRTKYSGLLLDGALQDGRITPATRKKWEDRFAAKDADFEALANELGDIDPTMKTTRKADNGKPDDANLATPADVTALANEYMESNKCSFEQAYARAKKQPQFAHLFTPKQADAQ